MMNNFVKKQARIHDEKEHDYGSLFVQGLAKYGETIWRWEVEKKLNRIRTWIKTKKLAVKNEGIENAVGDIFNYTVQMKLYHAAVVDGDNPLDCLTVDDFIRMAIVHVSPEKLVRDLTREQLIDAKKERKLIEVLLAYMAEPHDHT